MLARAIKRSRTIRSAERPVQLERRLEEAGLEFKTNKNPNDYLPWRVTVYLPNGFDFESVEFAA